MNRASRVRYVVLFGLCLAAAIAYIHRGCFGVCDKTIQEQQHLSSYQTSWILGVFFFTYACFQIPTGILVDRWGARRSLFLFGLLGAVTLALSASTMVLGATAAFLVYYVSRALMGISQAGLFPASSRCLASWIPESRRAFAAGTLQAVSGAHPRFPTPDPRFP